MTNAPEVPPDGPPCLATPSEGEPLAAIVDRLVALVREQEAQIAALQALVAELL